MVGSGARRWSVRIRLLAVVSVVALVALVIGSNLVLWWLARNHVVDDIEDLAGGPLQAAAAGRVAIVPGARVHPGGDPSRPLRDRLVAGVELHRSGLVDHVLVSGDNREGHYDEPTVMRRHVHLEGVPLAEISVDYAGFDTWDTCARARRTFGVDQAVFVTQKRYANRAAALCRAAGLDVVVLAVANPPRRPQGIWFKAMIREPLAAVKALFEVMLTPDPHHLGSFEGLAGSERPANPDPILGES